MLQRLYQTFSTQIVKNIKQEGKISWGVVKIFCLIVWEGGEENVKRL